MGTPDLDCSTLQMENQCQFYGPLELSPSLAPNIRAQATYVVTNILPINFIFDSFSSMSHDPAFHFTGCAGICNLSSSPKQCSTQCSIGQYTRDYHDCWKREFECVSNTINLKRRVTSLRSKSLAIVPRTGFQA